MSDPILQTQTLSIGYKGRGKSVKELQTNLNLQLYPNMFTVLVGPNGVGKSTLLRTLSGLQQPMGGMVTVQGKDLFSLSIGEKARMVSIVSTNNVDTSRLTVKEVVSIGRYAHTNWLGTMDNRNEALVQKALSTVGISHLIDRRLSEMSDGERQRVWVARALAQDTPLILLDEPTSYLDYKNRFEIFDLLRTLSHEGKSVLISTHELELALQFADRIWVMSDGIEQGSAKEIEESGVLAHIFGYAKDARQIQV